jgi:3-polyprenyl-4-hydroxybenzoate decarboxylase
MLLTMPYLIFYYFPGEVFSRFALAVNVDHYYAGKARDVGHCFLKLQLKAHPLGHVWIWY